MSRDEVLAVIWAMTGPDVYSTPVFERGWQPPAMRNGLGLLSSACSSRDLLGWEPKVSFEEGFERTVARFRVLS